MTPEMVLQTVRAVAEAVAETFRYLQTPAGQKSLEKMLEDQKQFEAGVTALRDWFAKLFTGRL